MANMNTEKSYQEKKEARMQKKEEERRANQMQRSGKKFGHYFVVTAIIFAIGYGFYFLAKNSTPKGEDFSKSVPVLKNTDHVDIGETVIEYNSDPPTSGQHYAQTARSGFREDTIADEHIVHNLEHGDIWISYNPRISESVKNELKQFAAAKVIITPRESNENDISLAAWGRLDVLNIENDALPIERIENFIKRYINKGPERIHGASGGV
jgi:hypothetical protein